jgi:hypothetical protein
MLLQLVVANPPVALHLLQQMPPTLPILRHRSLILRLPVPSIVASFTPVSLVKKKLDADIPKTA